MINVFSRIDELCITLREFKSNSEIIDFRVMLKIHNRVVIYILLENDDFQKESSLKKDNENIEIERVFTDELEFDSFYKNIFSSNTEEIIYKDSRRRFDGLLNDNNDFYQAPCPVVTFFSYKGGLGRSTTLACYAAYIAQHKKAKVFIIDCDFEAPGFTNFYLEKPYFPNHYNGLIEYINDRSFINDENLSLNQYSWEVSKEFSGEGEIRIMPAGNLSDSEIIGDWLEFDRQHYIEGLARLNINSSNYLISEFRKLIKSIHEQYQPDAILIDSRTGFNDIFGLTSLGLSNLAVGFFGNSIQNLPGLHFFIDFVRQTDKINFTGITVNSFSRRKLFDNFCQNIEDYLLRVDENDLINLQKFFLGRHPVLERIGTIEEDKIEFINFIQYREAKEYSDLFEAVYNTSNDFKKFGKEKLERNEEIYNDKFALVNESSTKYGITDEETTSNKLILKKQIIRELKANWAKLYAEDVEVFDKEFEDKRYFYRNCMLDIFNLNRFLILGNKGTGKTYIYKSLKNGKIINELKKRANKENFNYYFFHLIDDKEDLFFDTINFNNINKNINTDLFYRRFWLIYTWRAIMKIVQSNKSLNYKTSLSLDLGETPTETTLKYQQIINDDNQFILIEKDLKQFDDYLSTLPQSYVIIVLDDLDVMVQPLLWSERITPLLNFWKRNPYKYIIPKLFLRRDLFNKISGVTNIKELENQAISIEWSNEELFAFFFKQVFSKTRKEFFDYAKLNDKINNEVIKIIDKKSKNDNQPVLEEGHLAVLCEVFFGKYPDKPQYGTSYDWIYKNLKNADETISLRPFIDLLGFAIDDALENDETEEPILPPRFYTSKEVRVKAVENHFKDLASEKGNLDLQIIFDFIDDSPQYKYYTFSKSQINELLNEIITHKSESLEHKTIEDLIELLIVNGIIYEQNYGSHVSYSFAFLYKYRLGLKNRRKDRVVRKTIKRRYN